MHDVRLIETGRLRLRPMTVADGARVARWTADLDVARMTARVPHPQTVVGAEGWILIGLARAPLGRDFVFAVDLPGEGLIGCIGAHRLKPGAVEIGYWFGKPFWGRGYASEALGAFVEEAQTLGALEAGHFIDNPASGRVLERAGFAYTGETAAMFSLARGARVQSRRMRHGASHARWARELEACA